MFISSADSEAIQCLPSIFKLKCWRSSLNSETSERLNVFEGLGLISAHYVQKWNESRGNFKLFSSSSSLGHEKWTLEKSRTHDFARYKLLSDFPPSIDSSSYWNRDAILVQHENNAWQSEIIEKSLYSFSAARTDYKSRNVQCQVYSCEYIWLSRFKRALNVWGFQIVARPRSRV